MPLQGSRAISTDIVDLRARVLAIEGGKGRLMESALIRDTGLSV
jgi:hypothetical protein